MQVLQRDQLVQQLLQQLRSVLQVAAPRDLSDMVVGGPALEVSLSAARSGDELPSLWREVETQGDETLLAMQPSSSLGTVSTHRGLGMQ